MTPAKSVGRLELALREARANNQKLLVPYLTGGLTDDWLDVLRATVAAGADAIEIGIPFSDPMIDGPVIQQASQQALVRGARPQAIIGELAHADVGVPLVVMTYANIVARAGYRRMARNLIESGVSGAIVPDLPLDEATEWLNESGEVGLENVLLVAPTTPDDRLAKICERSRGFVYAVGLLGVTGERTALSDTALTIARRVKAVTDVPVLIGIGISNAAQAVEACEVADGVIVGSALVRRLLDGEGARGAGAFISELRSALDKG